MDTQRQIGSYFLGGIEENHSYLVSMMSPIQNTILYSIGVQVEDITRKIELVIYNCNNVETYKEEGGLPDSDNISSRRVLGITRNYKKEAHDGMVCAVETFYLVAMEFLKI